jgi:hypothetical protein
MYINGSRGGVRVFLQATFLAASAVALLHCGGVDGTTVAPDETGDDTSSGVHTEDGGVASNDAGTSATDGGHQAHSDGGGGEVDSGKPAGPPLLYGITGSDIYSFDTVTDTIHHVASFAAGSCGYLNDIEIDASGRFFGASDITTTLGDGGSEMHYTTVAIAIAGGLATCTPLDASQAMTHTSLGFRNAGDMLGVSFTHSAYVGTVNPATGVAKENLFLLDATNDDASDVTCSKDGTCWASLMFPSSSEPAIVSFSDTLTGAAATTLTSNLDCWGLAYASHALYCFEAGGGIVQVDLTSAPPKVTVLPLHMDDASTIPSYWSGAASQPN